MKPFLSITNDLPLLLQVSKSEAVFETNNTTYNESGYTYNQSGWTYGGRDIVQDSNLIQLFINKDKPTLIFVGDQPATTTTLITLYEGMPMGLLLTITYPTTIQYYG